MHSNTVVCRICLKNDAKKDIRDLQRDIKGSHKNYMEIMQFCLDIEIIETSVDTKLCLKCYKKIIAYHKFKVLALKSDAFLRSIDSNPDIKNDILHSEIKEEMIYDDHDFNDNGTELDSLEVKDSPSDDELLSTVKKIKYEFIPEDTKENAPIKKRKGRPKKIKSENAEVKIEKEQVCEECGKTVRKLKEHMRLHIPDRKPIKCKVCEKEFSSYSARYKHHKIKHLCIKSHCDLCNKDYTNIRQHNLVVHDKEKLRFQCVSCGNRFISQSSLDAHMTRHTKDKPFECDQCGNRYRCKLQVTQHIRQVHELEKNHLCQFCSKSFFKKYHLQIHLRVHTKERPYTCTQCNKSFSNKTTLRNHIYIHSADKAFECTLCEMKFRRPGYLRAHMVSHTKEKRYPCKYCGVAFGRSDHRKRHQYTAHEKHLTNNVTVTT